MSHDETETDTTSIDGPFETGESSTHIIDAEQAGSGKTHQIGTRLAYRLADSETVEFIDPKGNAECPLGDHPSTSETQDVPEDNADRDSGGESS